MSTTSITDVAEALFVSNLQPSDQPTIEETAIAVLGSLQQYGGVRGCAAICAAEFGEHPETAPTRMRWALALARKFAGRRYWLPRFVTSMAVTNRARLLAQLTRAVSAAEVVRADRSEPRSVATLGTLFRRSTSVGIMLGAVIAAATIAGNSAAHAGMFVRSGAAFVCVAAGVGWPACRRRFGARRGQRLAAAREPERGRGAAVDASQDWIIQHLFGLGLKLQAAAARSDIDRVREEMEAVVDGLDEVIVMVRCDEVAQPVRSGAG